MLIKFLRHSKGSGRAAINYLLGEKDHKGERRAGVKVLRGDPYLIADLIDSMDTVHRYTSGVIAWHPEDKPTDEEIESVLSDYEAVAFSGLDADQFSYCAVLHIESDGTQHIHLVNPRVELITGKALNIAPPGHEYYFKHWRDGWNSEKGWKSPADVALVRSPREPKGKILPEWKFRNFHKEVVQQFLLQELNAGTFENRDEMISYLNRYGEVTRVGKDYISFKAQGKEKAVRFKGALFSEGWVYNASDPELSSRPNPEKSKKHREQLKSLYEKRVAYNASRYQREEIECVSDFDLLMDIDNEQQAAYSYPEYIIDAVERAAESNRVADEINKSVQESGGESISAGTEQAIVDVEREIARTEQSIESTKQSIERTEQSAQESSRLIATVQQGLSIIGESVKIIGIFVGSIKSGVKKMFSAAPNKEVQMIVSANSEKKAKEENESREYAELIISNIKKEAPKTSNSEELALQRESLIRIVNMSQEAQQDRVVEWLADRESISYDRASIQVESMLTSGSVEMLSEYQQMLMQSLASDLAKDKAPEDTPQVSREKDASKGFDGPSM